jgi:hypothetical protein
VFQRVVRSIGDQWADRRVSDVRSMTDFYVSDWLRTGASVTGSDLTRIAVDRLAEAFPGSDFV